MDGRKTLVAPVMARAVAELVNAADDYVPRGRSEALVSKWLPDDGLKESSERLLEMMADAVSFAEDAVLSHLSASGSDAFDRLAKARGAGLDADALTALRRARFRLLRLDGAPDDVDGWKVRDVLTGEALALVGFGHAALGFGDVVFGRFATLPAGTCCCAGLLTPLDAAALDMASRHPAAGRPGKAAGIRWAEAVYLHIVRHGTLNVPGLNRDDEPPIDDHRLVLDDHPQLDLARAWAELAGATPDETLLGQARALANVSDVTMGLAGAVLARAEERTDIADAFEAMLLVAMDTMRRRESVASHAGTLDDVARILAEAAQAVDGPEQLLPSTVQDLFERLRRQLPGGRPANPSLDRLVSVIQALRAKTVESGCTEHEALAAAEKVAELLDRHGLSMSELDVQAQPCEGIGVETTRRRLGPIDECIPKVGAFFDCRVWVEQAPGRPLRYVFFGMRGDVTAAEYLYVLVERAFETETAAFKAGPLYRAMAGERRRATTSFQAGMAQGLVRKLDALRLAREGRARASGHDLVPAKTALIDDEVAKLGIALRQISARTRTVLTDALEAGEEAGARFEFTPGIASEA